MVTALMYDSVIQIGPGQGGAWRLYGRRAQVAERQTHRPQKPPGQPHECSILSVGTSQIRRRVVTLRLWRWRRDRPRGTDVPG